MTTLTGAASLPVFHLASHYTVSANLQTIRLARVPSVVGLDRAGSRTFTLPGVLPQASLAGAADRTFRDDWYHRIHLLPAAIDFQDAEPTWTGLGRPVVVPSPSWLLPL